MQPRRRRHHRRSRHRRRRRLCGLGWAAVAAGGAAATRTAASTFRRAFLVFLCFCLFDSHFAFLVIPPLSENSCASTALRAGIKFTGCIEICFANINKEAELGYAAGLFDE